jgi:hypothetical protein
VRRDDKEKGDAKSKPNEPFVLTYSQRAKWSHWKEALATRAKYEFGERGWLCDLDDYPLPTAINPEDYPELASQSLQVRKIGRAIMMADITERQRSIARMNADKAKLFSLIKTYLSQKSIAVVMRSAF